MKKTIAAIYTGKGLADPLQAVINRTLPDWRLISIIDDQIIGEVKEAGSPTPEIYQRLISYYKAAEAMGADVILNTCSSVGDVSSASSLRCDPRWILPCGCYRLRQKSWERL